MIRVKQITYLPADIFAMFAVPQMILPAPPSGKINNIVSVTHDMVFSTLAYTVATFIGYGKNPANNRYIFYDSISLPAVANSNFPLNKLVADFVTFSTIKDLFVTTDAAALTGDSKIKAFIIYEQKDVEL